MIAAFYDLETHQDLRSAITDLRGYWKLWNACLLRSVSLTSLRGVIATRPYQNLGEDIHRFLQNVGAAKALIRHDTRDEKPPYPRGGFVVPESVLHEVLVFFFRQNRIVAVYEPADPLLNSYNLNVLFESATDVWVEVLGPGFDASDLQRGDLSPHEAFSISLSPNGAITEIQRVHCLDQPEYETSKQLRWQKIRRKLEQWPTRELARAIRSDLKLPENLEKHLKTVRSPLLEAQHYVPVSETLLTNTVSAIVDSGIIKLFSSSTGIGFPLNFSTSLIDNGRRQVFWDIVSPALKFRGLKT